MARPRSSASPTSILREALINGGTDAPTKSEGESGGATRSGAAGRRSQSGRVAPVAAGVGTTLTLAPPGATPPPLHGSPPLNSAPVNAPLPGPPPDHPQ